MGVLLALTAGAQQRPGDGAPSGTTRSPAGEAAPFSYEHHEVVTGSAISQTVLPGFFLGGATADLAVVSVDDSHDRRLVIYAFGDGTWARRLEATLGSRVSFVDAAAIGGRDRLITHESGRLSWFDPDSATERPLVDVAIAYDATPAGLEYAGLEPTQPFQDREVPRVDLTRDLNRDGRDDLVIPGVDGFKVLVQTSGGAFAPPLALGPPEPFRDEVAFDSERRYGEVGLTALTVPLYLSRVHVMDYNRDGRSDLVFWNEDHFEVHYQNANGLFEPVAESFTVDVPFDADGAYSMIFGFGDNSSFRLITGFRKKTRRTMLHSFRDINGDRVADLVTFSLEGRSLLRQRSLYEVRFGAPTPGGTSFARQASTAVRSRRKRPLGYSSAWFRDLDGDGRVDIVVTGVKTGIGRMISALLNRSITVEGEFFVLDEGTFPDKAVTTRKFTADVDLRGGRDAGFWPPALLGDVNGDGRSDVLVGKNREELHVFLGMPGPEVLASQPQKVAVTLPGDERNSWLTDLNGDGKQDLLMHHPSVSEPHRVTMLIAR